MNGSPVLRILRAKPNDAPVLTEIAFAAKRHWNYPEQWIQSWRDSLTIQLGFIAEHETYAAITNDRPVGFYSLSRARDGMALEHLWVHSHAMRKGVGRALFRHAITRVSALGCKSLRIESDPNAQGFYERMGARCVGTAVTRLECQPRKLPVLIYDLKRAGVELQSAGRQLIH
jgi:GNAT superfamily N-acetyltransferase